jgi:ABC-type transport system substrate-binding protein
VSGYPAYDLDKAKDLVSQLGGLSFTMILSNSPANLQLAQALQSQWEEAGIKVTLDPQEQTTLITNVYSANYQAELGRWKGAYDPDGNVYQFFSSKAGQTNYARVSDSALDALLDQGRQSTDPATRKQIYQQVAEKLAELLPYNFLWAFDAWRITTNKVHGIPALPQNILLVANAYLS